MSRAIMSQPQKYLGTLLLLISCAAAQSPQMPATLRSVIPAQEGKDLRVEISLSAPVKPSVEATDTRIILNFSDTVCRDHKDLTVSLNGVRRIRATQLNPAVAQVVLELDRMHDYEVTTEGSLVLVKVGKALKKQKGSGAPVAATSGNLVGIFRRHRDAAPTAAQTADSLPPIPPAPSSGPPFEAGSANAGASVPNITTPQQAHNQSTPGMPSPPVAQAPFDSQSNSAATPATGTISSTTLPSTLNQSVAQPQAQKEQSPASPGASASATSGADVAPLIARPDDPGLHTVFRVKYVAEGVAYLDGGRAQGLSEGMHLEVKDSNLPAKQGDSANDADPSVIAELDVSAVADTSAVTDIRTPKRPVKVGDLAYLSSTDTEALIQQRALSATRQYPAVVSFTEGDTLDEEVRNEVPRPPLPSVNRARGRFGFDTTETISHGATSLTSTDVGFSFRGDITRIGGTYWNLSGYWRGRITKESAASQQTLQSLINRTYHLNLTYDNPNSSLVAGFGRLYLPWASSLDTIDGGYVGKRFSGGKTVGIFGGSTPDPSSWNYSPNRAIGGAFLNFSGGEFDGFHYSSTSGVGVSMIKWSIDRPFVFFEDSLSYKRTIALYESAQLDSPKGNPATPSPGAGLGRNFLTLRVNPAPRVELDVNYNYFRDVPTFNPTLVGTTLVDKYLFQGFSAGGRVEVHNQIWLSANLGRSSGGVAKPSLNEMFGITFGRIPKLDLRADLHYARFNSSFGSGSYQAFSLSRQMSDRIRLEVLMGQQNFASAFTTNTRGRFFTGTVETNLGPHYYLQANFTTNRGAMSYEQLMFSFGYRFDSKRKGE